MTCRLYAGTRLERERGGTWGSAWCLARSARSWRWQSELSARLRVVLQRRQPANDSRVRRHTGPKEIDVGIEGLSLGDQAVFSGPLATGRLEGRPTRDRLYVHVRAGAEGGGAVPSDRHTA
jgi:hypothetical protein